MKPAACRAGVLALALAVAGAAPVLACGYHDPDSVKLKRGVLNWVFPDALHVTSAVWMAQADGLIARDESPQAVRALLGYQRTARRLDVVRERLAAAAIGDTGMPGFSMVLLGPMLWVRFEPAGTGLEMTLHADGASSGVTVVTDEPVIAALADGRVSAQRAGELGLMRYYGTPDGVQDVKSLMDGLSRTQQSGLPY